MGRSCWARLSVWLLACICLSACGSDGDKHGNAAGAGGQDAGAPTAGGEVCGNVIDDDGDLEPDCSDPDCLAKVADPTQPSAFADTVAWLYAAGGNGDCEPLQGGVAAGALAPGRVSVLRGRVSDVEGKPLAGAVVRVVGAPELGRSRSRGDGVFDIAVNGGGKVTLEIGGGDYLPVHRRTGVLANDFAWVEPTVLKTRSAAVTPVDLATGQVLHAEASEDASGRRAPVVLFPPGMAAVAETPDGMSMPLAALSVRFTEFTVGERGPEAMPADLPASSAYTYAFEISADEADAMSANTLRFDRPLPVYLENFLGFPAGTQVPVGYYDRQAAAWKPEADGMVVEIVGEAKGAATLDVDGDGSADDGDALEALGITSDELARLAELYEPGQSLWRVPINHFSAWDFNWPFGFPLDAIVPPFPELPFALTDTPGCASGSVVRVDNQTLGESVDVAGTGYSLFYQSDRSPGGQLRTLDIEVAGDAPPSSLKRIDVSLSIAGHLQESAITPAPNARFHYDWDGTNAYGRPLTIAQPYKLRLDYVYDGVYARADRLDTSNFAQPSNGTQLLANATREEVSSVRELRGTLGGWDARANGLGGFTLDVHHAYDPATHTLYYGDGRQRSAETVPPVATDVLAGRDFAPYSPLALPDGSLLFVSNDVIYRFANGEVTPFAGGGAQRGAAGDGGPALAAALEDVADLKLGPDGSVYFWSGPRSGQEGERIRRVDPSGTISSVFGADTDDILVAEGKLATEINIISAGALAVSADGQVYVTEYATSTVFRIAANGRLEQVTGGNSSVEGTPSRNFGIFSPSALGFAPDGSLYISGNSNSIWRIDPDGLTTTVAGDGKVPGSSTGDGGTAREATLDTPRDIAIDSGGTVYIAEVLGRRIRTIDANGVIQTLFRTPYPNPAPDSLSIGPDGAVYVGVSEVGDNRILKLTPALPGATLSDVLIAAEDGSEVYRFDRNGRHLATFDALTSTELRRFEYDDNGRLARVVEEGRRTTQIERNTDGVPTAIVGPYGVRTELTLGADGFLERVQDPAGQAVSFEYAPGGLLSAMVDARGGRHEYGYEGNRLVSDRDPSGAVQTLAASRDGQTSSVTLTSPLGRVTRHDRIANVDGEEQRTTTPSGAVSSSVRDADGNVTVTAADGSTIATVVGADPRFGALAPLSAETTVTLPSGTASVVTQAASAELANSGDPFSVTRLQSETQINGRTFTSEYEAATRTLVLTSAEGRQLTRILDAQGRLIEQRTPGLLSTFYEYDADGRLSAVTSGGGTDARRLSFAHNPEGWLAAVTDALGQSTRYVADAIGRTTSAQYADGSAIGFAYDAGNNLTELTPPNQPAHRLQYDLLNLLSAYLPPELDSGATPTAYTYDADRALTSIALPGIDPIGYSYSPTGLLSSAQHPAGTVAFTYDSAERLIGSTSADGVALAYAYDGPLPQSTTWSGPIAGSVERAYDRNFFVTSLTVNGATPIEYAYDDDGLMTQAGPVSLAYDATNALLVSTNTGNIETAFTHSPRGELSSHTVTANDAPLYAATYTYDALGRIATASETVAGTTTQLAYTYDSVGQLIEANTDGTPAAYTYDANGNRLTAPSGAASYDVQDRLLSSGDSTFTYSARGTLETRTTAGATTRYTYDALGNLTAVALPDGRNITYLTDARGHRVAKLVDGNVQRAWLYQDELEPIAELDADGNVVSRFVYAARSNVPDVMLQAGNTYTFITDLRGSVRLVVDAATGEVAQRIDYGPFGEVLADSNPGFQPFAFAGGLYDPDTELVRFGARDYQASAGRWLSKDPIGFSGGQANLYAYVGNDPVGHVDPRGEFANLLLGGVTGIATGWAFATITGNCYGWRDGVRDFALGAVGAGLASKLAKLGSAANEVVTVSRWGRPGLQPGDWVMKGPVSRWNYFWSGKWQPGMGNQFARFSTGEQFQVRAAELAWPRETNLIVDTIKGLLGQRIYRP